MSVLPLCRAVVSLVFVLGFLHLPAISRADTAADALGKWGVKPGQKAGEEIAASERRQPLIDNYPVWLAAKFIPDYFDDETVRRYVIKELDKSRRFYRDYRGKGPDQPWLSEAEVKDRNPELAAPEFMDRYKALIRDFTAGLSTRARVYYQLGAPNYNVKTGRMQFGPSKEQTNLAWQVTPEEHSSRGYIGFRQQFGAEIANRAANKTAGYRLGLLGNSKKGDARIRVEPDNYIPLILRSGGKSAASRLPLFLALDRNLVTRGVPMSQRDAERFLNQYGNRPNASVEIDIRVKDAVHMAGAGRGEVLILVADVEEVRLYSPLRPVRVNDVPTARSELVARYSPGDLPPATDSLAEQRANYEKKTSQARAEAASNRQQQQTQIAEKTRECETSGMPQCWGALCKMIAATGDRQKQAWCTAQRKQAMLNYAKTFRQQQQAALAGSAQKILADKAGARSSQGSVVPAHCRSRYSGRNAAPWYPHSGSADYEAAMAACSKEQARNPYGPDILGLRLGMTQNETLPLLQRQNMTRSSKSNDARPFQDARLQWTREGEHGIALFYLYSGPQERVSAISRRIFFDDKPMKTGPLRDGLRKKYGRELWTKQDRNGAETLLWVFPGKGKQAAAGSCKGLVERVEERGDWRREWAAPRGTSKIQSASSGGSPADVKQQCFKEAGLTPGAMPAMDMSKMMAMQACMQKNLSRMVPGAAAPDKPDTRKPLMVSKSGTPSTYAGFRDCGPAIIARFSHAGEGDLEDLSLLLFDPAWLAEQPNFMFDAAASQKERGAGVQF